MAPASLIEIGKKNYDNPECKTWHTYSQYERHLKGLRDIPLKILEIGVHTGASIAVWEEYFPNAMIVGLDILKIDRKFGDRVHIVQGSQCDEELLKKISERFAPDGWDIIIDDASHIGHLSKTTICCLFPNHLKKGGLYFLEDWGTGYWDDWPDGQYFIGPGEQQPEEGMLKKYITHDVGMVGLVKQMVDEAGMDSIKRLSSDPPFRGTMFEYMEVNYAFAMAKKL
jgi:hypothetical protein